MQLKREISKFNLLLISIGSIVGSGWLFGSFYTAKIAGPAALLSWLIAAAFVTVIGLTLAELCSALPLSGGSTAYVSITHGRFTGGVFAWVTWLWVIIIAPIEVQAIMQYASNYIPGMLDSVTHVHTFKGILFAALLMLILSIINVIGVKFMAETNKIIVFWKLAIPVAIAFILIFYRPHITNLSSAGFAPEGLSGIFSAISAGGVALSFFGFQSSIFLAGEAKDPGKAIPYSLFGSIFFCTLLYVGLQLGFILAVSPEALANGGWANISFVGDAGPFAGIFLAIGMTLMVGLLYFDAVLSPFGTAVGYVATSSRVLYSLGLQGDGPKILTKTNKFAIPWVAITVNFFIGMLLFLPFSGWQEMAAYISAAVAITLAVIPICLPIFRRKFPELQRPFKIKHVHLTCFVSFYFCNLMLHWTGWNTIWKLMLAVGVGILLKVINGFRNKNQGTQHFKEFLWVFVYLICSSLVSFLGSFGGGLGILSMKVDYLIILVTSLFVYILAQKTALSDNEAHKIYVSIKEQHRLPH